MSVIHVDELNFNTEVLENTKTVLVDFWATWCGPCKMIAPIVEEVASQYPEYAVCKIDVDKAPALARKYGIDSIPTLLVFKNGTVVNKAVGVRPKEKILELLNV